ncbi:MAG: exodeoxyribonuclease VII large subunit [Eggerthellaceae bacterium]|nr:exodeoxyribonuclease VII large subunit [Eggerthellaceae bacterium]
MPAESYQRDRDDSSALSVSAAMALAKGALESVTVRMVGEVSELSNKAGYKAVYFTIKDKSASLPCMMWNNRYLASGVSLSVGALVEITGRFTLYAAKGRMNFEAFSLSLAGEGKLRMQVAELAKKLQAEGLMEPSRKRALPAYPLAIGLVTSPRGAAVHDVLRTLRRRYPMAQVMLAGVPVEGAQAPRYLQEGIRCVVQHGAEVVLVVRGGGSFEDLMPFNDEGLARCIASCSVPVVTGIGHEPDTSIADMVADVRASTPTAAAEAVAPDQASISAQVDSCAQRLSSRLLSRIERSQLHLDRVLARDLFSRPESVFSSYALMFDDLASRLPLAIPRALERDRILLDSKEDRLYRVMPNLFSRHRASIEAVSVRLDRGIKDALECRKRQIALTASRLNDLSPLAVIARGYGMARDADGRLVKSIDDISAGDEFTLQLSDGEVVSHVLSTNRVDTGVYNLKELL